MTIGELKKAIAPLDNALEIEIIVPYGEDDDGDEVERSYELTTARAVMDTDTAGEYARFECVGMLE